jgi:hypothetical protein
MYLPMMTLVVALEWWIGQFFPYTPSACRPMKISKEGNHMVKDGGLGFRIVDIQDDAIHEIGEHNFP